MFSLPQFPTTPHFATMAGLDAFLKDDSARNLRSLLKVVILVTISAAAVASRLFSVIRMFSSQSQLEKPVISTIGETAADLII